MSETYRDALSDVPEALPVVQEWTGDPPGCPAVVGGPLGCPGVVGGPPGCPRGLAGAQECSGRPPESSSVVEKPSRMSGSGREALLEVQEALPVVRECAVALQNVRE